MLNRRFFVQRGAAVLALATSGFGLAGCDTATVATFVTTIAKYAAQLATYFSASSLAGQITALAATIATDIQNWQSGGTSADAIEALNDLADLINQIPILGPYAVFIDLLLGAISGLLALLPSSATSTVALSNDTHTKKLAAIGFARRVAAPIPYSGFDKQSMTAANNGLCAQWARYELTLPTTK